MSDNFGSLLRASIEKHVPLPTGIRPDTAKMILDDITKKVHGDLFPPIMAMLGDAIATMTEELLDELITWNATLTKAEMGRHLLAAKAEAKTVLRDEMQVKPSEPHAHTEHGCVCGGHD